MGVGRAAKRMDRALDTTDIRGLRARNFEHPRCEWVAESCLTCANCTNCTNCTLVCPTCLRSSGADTTDLAVEKAERWHRWDSCFGLDHPYIHGGSVRATAQRTGSSTGGGVS